MSMAMRLRNGLTNLPLPLGQLVANLPYEWRPGIGGAYRRHLEDLRTYESFSVEQKREWVFQKIKQIVEFSVINVPFYRKYYAEQKFDAVSLRSFDDIKRIPITNKGILRKSELEARSANVKQRYVVNTGGSSGTTLDFYVQPEQMGNEWAHMHSIWSQVGYDPRCLKLTFGGRSDVKTGIQYDSVRHSVNVDIYADIQLVASKLNELLSRHDIYFLHGYPSAIYEFALACRDQYPEIREKMSRNLRGVFLSSEYPTPYFRQTIEDVFACPSISWYGHTERCILAPEIGSLFVYHPLQSYGYAEAEPCNNSWNLIGTSYFNRASPLIRYDTEDQATMIQEDEGILTSFQVGNGRNGQFIVDKRGGKIPLTGLIFGRHHTLFDHCSHIQVCQQMPGKATILWVPFDRQKPIVPHDLFDAANVEIDFDFRKLAEPIRTPSGKVNLLATRREP